MWWGCGGGLWGLVMHSLVSVVLCSGVVWFFVIGVLCVRVLVCIPSAAEGKLGGVSGCEGGGICDGGLVGTSQSDNVCDL